MSNTLAGSGVETDPPLLELPPVFVGGLEPVVPPFPPVLELFVPGPSPTTHQPLSGTLTLVEPSWVPVGLETVTVRV